MADIHTPLAALLSLGFGFERADEKIGWRGVHPKPTTDRHFRCEFCGEEHLDCTEIAHSDDCPVSQARAAFAAPTPAHQFTGDGPGVLGADNCQICGRWFNEPETDVCKNSLPAPSQDAETIKALRQVRALFNVEYGSDPSFRPSIGYDSDALPKVIAILDAALAGSAS